MAEKKYYVVVTGVISPGRKRSREAVEFVTKQEGFVGVYPMDGYTAWLFDTRNNAVGAMNMMNSVGIQTGKEVGGVYADLDGKK